MQRSLSIGLNGVVLQPLLEDGEDKTADGEQQPATTSGTGDGARQTRPSASQRRRVRFAEGQDEVETGDGDLMPYQKEDAAAQTPMEVEQLVDAMLDAARASMTGVDPSGTSTVTVATMLDVDGEAPVTNTTEERPGATDGNEATNESGSTTVLTEEREGGDRRSTRLVQDQRALSQQLQTDAEIAATMETQLEAAMSAMVEQWQPMTDDGDAGASPTEISAAFAKETAKKDGTTARILQVRAAERRVEAVTAEEAARRLRKASKRRERMKRREARRSEKSQDMELPITTEAIAVVTSTRRAMDPMTKKQLEPGVTAEADVAMPEPSDEFRDAMQWSVRAVEATNELRARQGTLADGLARLAKSEMGRLEDLAAGAVVGENDRPGVAVQLVAAAEGLKAIGEDTWIEEADVPVEMSRARRRHEKRIRKARAKEQRDLLAQYDESGYPADAFFSYDEHRRSKGRAKVLSRSEAEAIGHALPFATDMLRKLKASKKTTKAYAYRSGSQYESPGALEKDGKVYRVGKLKAVQAPVTDLLPTAMLEVKGQWRQVKLDTGAQYSVAGKSWTEYGTRINAPAPVDFMEGFSGAAVRVLGVWRFDFRTAYSQPMRVDALIVEHDTTDFLIGEDWMYDHGVKIDFVSGEMKWYRDGDKLVVPFTGVGTSAQRGGRVAKVRLLRRAKVRTQTVRNVEVAVPAADGTIGMFVPKARKEQHLLVAPTLVTVREGKATVPILNLVGRTTKLPSREALGTWMPLDEELEVMELEGELDRERVSQWVDELSTHARPLVNEDELVIGGMSEDEKDLLLKLLRHYPQMLEPRDGCPPATTLGVEHYINTGNEGPIRTRPRRYSRSEHEVIDGEVEQMLHDGVIEESTGAWGFPVVLVRKKDGSVRFCIDYRMLNAITKKDIYPLPRIDEALESMHGAKRFSSLDLHAGYWQVPVAEDDRDKTGFVTRKGLFRFVRMPFGLANAPGTFQRMMDAVLRGLTWRSCLVYLDDVIVFSGGEIHRHVIDLATVMERLARAGLSLKPKKCSFAMERLEYLGHELDDEGIRPLETLVDSVRRFPVPKDQTEVRRFVHLAGYYRRFVPNFGTKAAPLTKLLRRTTEWQWGTEQQEAFDKLKAELTERPLLIYPDFTKPFKLVTDASVVGLGAALMQDHGNGDQPVAFASKVNSPTVAKYGITDLECAAVVWAVRLFRPYLYGRRFQLVTDHSALTWLMKSKDLSGRLHRWALQLQEYDFAITYRAGSTNVVADALSRAPVRTLAASGRPTQVAGRNAGAERTPSVTEATTTGVAADEIQAPAVTSNETTVNDVDVTNDVGVTNDADVTDDVSMTNNVAGAGDTSMAPDTTVTNNQSTTSAEPRMVVTAAVSDERRTTAVSGDPSNGQVPDAENGQLTDDEIRRYQRDDKFVKRLSTAGRYKSQTVKEVNGVVHVRGDDGVLRVVLPVALRAKALREAHDSIYAGHLRTPQTYARVTNTYWWPDVRTQVKLWVRSCRDCGTRKTQPKAVIPPLRSQGVGDVGDRWAIDVAGPLPVTPNGNRYVIAAVDYASRYAIAVATPSHTAEHIAKFIAERVVLVHGPMRELAMDGAPELNGKVVKQLTKPLQVRQMTPVPYRPMLLGLVERYHKVWKDMVSMYVDEQQDDWDQWLPSAVYAYNGAKHGTTGFTPNELMMGRRLRSPNELLRTSRVTMVGKWSEYHRKLVGHLERASAIAKVALQRDQQRRERYYNRRVREREHYTIGDVVWILKPPRGKGVTKLAHQWVGPARIDADAGFDNWRVTRLDTQDELIVHCSFLLSYHFPPGQRETVADRILRELADGEDEGIEDEGRATGADRQEPDVSHGQDRQGGAVGANQGQATEPEHTGEAGNIIRDGVTTSATPATARATEPPARPTVTTATPRIATGTNSRTTQGENATKVVGAGTLPDVPPPGIADRGTTPSVVAVRRRDRPVQDTAVGKRPRRNDGTAEQNEQSAERRSAGGAKPPRKRRSDDREGQRQREEVRLTEQQKRRRIEREAREARAVRRGTARDEQAATATMPNEADAHRGVLRITRPHGVGTTDDDGGVDDEAERASCRHDEQNIGEGDEGGQPATKSNDGDATDSRAATGALRGRGQARRMPLTQHLLETAARGTVVERARRRVRNKAGRYVLQYQVEFGVRAGGPTTKEWLSAREFEDLFDDGKIGDDLLSGDGVWTARALGGDAARSGGQPRESDDRSHG